MSKRRRKTNREKRERQRQKVFENKILRFDKALSKSPRSQKEENLLKDLKGESFGVLNKVYGRVASSHLELNRIIGDTFPSSYSGFKYTINMPFSGSIESELNWMAFLLTQHASKLNVFIELKEAYDSSFLSGDYSQSSRLLKQIETQVGLSLWSIESNLLLAECEGGLEANKTFLENIINNEWNKKKNLCVLVDLYSYRSEIDISYASFSNTLTDLTKHHASNPSLTGLLQYMKFKLDYVDFNALEHLAYIVYLENTLPIVDRYLTCIRVLNILASTSNSNVSTSILSTANHLNSFIPDDSTSALITYYDSSHKAPKNELQTMLLCGYDLYTIGDYEAALDVTTSMLHKGYHSLKIYELHVKTLLHLQRDLDLFDVINETSLAFQIMLCLFNIIAKTDKTRPYILKLRKIGCALGCNSISCAIHAFAAKHQYHEHRDNIVTLDELSSLPITPRFSMAIKECEESLNYLRILKTQYEDSPTIDFFWQILNDADLSNLQVPDIRKLKYQIRRHVKEQEYSLAITKLSRLSQILPTLSPYHTDVLMLQFECYLGSHNYVDCLRLVVETYLQNANLLLPLDLERLYETITKPDFVRDQKDICLPILEHSYQHLGILPKDTWRLYVTLDDFMNAVGIERPSQLNPELFESNKLIYLLRHICIPEVLEDTAGIYMSSEDIQDERILICQSLLIMDSGNESVYSAEIKRLMKEQMTRKAIQHIDKSRIHIETEGVLSSLGVLYQERFERCLGLSRLDEVLRKSPKSTALTRLTEESGSVVLVSDIAYENFEDLFNELTRQS